MKTANKLLVALCLALIACLAMPALMPAAQAAAAINKKKATIYNGQKLQLKVSGTTEAVRWSSSNAKVATVNQKGLVKAKKVGKATITAQVGAKKLNCLVTVKTPLTASAKKLTLDVDMTGKVTLNYKLSGKLSLKKYDTSLLKCSLGKISKGKCTLTVKALRAGSTTLTVKNSKTGDTVKIKVTVREEQPHSDIVDKTELVLAVGETGTVNVKWPFEGLPYFNYGWNATCAWGEWSGDGWPMYITGVKKGTLDVVITKGEGGDEVARIKVIVE